MDVENIETNEPLDPAQAHMARLLDETKAAKQQRTEALDQVESAVGRKNAYKAAYTAMVKDGVIKSVLSGADINAAGKALVTAHVESLLIAGKNEETNLPSFTFDGFDSVDELIKDIKESETFAACVTCRIGGATIISRTVEPNRSSDMYRNKAIQGLGIG